MFEDHKGLIYTLIVTVFVCLAITLGLTLEALDNTHKLAEYEMILDNDVTNLEREVVEINKRLGDPAFIWTSIEGDQMLNDVKLDNLKAEIAELKYELSGFKALEQCILQGHCPSYDVKYWQLQCYENSNSYEEYRQCASLTTFKSPLREQIWTEEQNQEVWYHDMPFISQVTDPDTYTNDCASASILMVANSYFGGGCCGTVTDIHEDMVGYVDAGVNFRILKDYLENNFPFNVDVITTYEPIIPMLEERGFETDDIHLVDDIPYHIPVIWVYLQTDHWVVRYKDMNYDPRHGMYPFEDTAELRNMFRPELGLGLVVTLKEVN